MSKTVKTYTNPHGLDLVLARCFGWGWTLVFGSYVVTLLADVDLGPYSDHWLELTIFAAVIGVIIGASEARAEKRFSDFEVDMQRTIAGLPPLNRERKTADERFPS